ncbi:hypothetical protein M422DRAFT_178931 [Sphaerobolus stellatus SS14]|uniref:Vacuolar sorting protein 39/Transforming growth factor beta receptor-associated domain-containing protein n=1 Tax=Sphaerobolus stellatus (strain SS14) TaxID=990650 RepID=A0A0C9VGM6_SPHS4|nr:hypothetical protein M422DRAFT_178931 [Sphaerobolus stellatus SS14]
MVNSLESQELVQELPPLDVFAIRQLDKSYGGYVIPSSEESRALDIVKFNILQPDAPDSSAIEEEAIEKSATSRPLPPRGDSLKAESTKGGPSRQGKAILLATGNDAVYALATPTLVQQIDVLLEGHKLKEATEFAKEQQKRLDDRKKRGSLSPGDIDEEIRYVYQRLGYTYFSQTNFEDAGINLFRGGVDPRLLIRLFPTLRGRLLPSSSSLPVFHGLISQLQSLGSIDTIIVTNLVKNYTPHLRPNTRSAPPTSELRKLLQVSARDMLREYLRKWKNKALYSGETLDEELSQIIDTVQAKIFAETEETQELYSLIDSQEHIIVDEVEETLIRNGQYNALLRLHAKRSNKEKLLEIWSKLVDGDWTDEDVRDPLGQMTTLLAEMRDRSLTHRWGLWLVRRDAAAGLKLILSAESKKSGKSDDAALLAELERISPEAGQQFLEHIVLNKRNHDPALHSRLAQTYLDQLISYMEEGETAEFFALYLSLFDYPVFEYSIQNSPTPFLTHLATLVDASSPMFKLIRTRCRAALFFQGSAYYDVSSIRDRLLPWKESLSFEVAIVDGKLGRHDEALRLLVHNLRDTTCADAYCALGGCAISPRVAQSVGERLDLQQWADLVVSGLSRKTTGAKAAVKQEELEETKGQLLRVLLEVYMSGGQATEAHTARLLNTQGGNLDVLDVLTLVPPSWSLNVVSSFLARSIRHSVHNRCEAEILKAIALGQNLAIRDEAYVLLNDQGAFLEEPLPGTEESPASSPPVDNVGGVEPGTFEEKKIVVIEHSDEDNQPVDGEKPVLSPTRPISPEIEEENE